MANNVMNNEGTPTTGIQNIYYAVNLWVSDNAQALLDYGPISDWNTTACIHMGWLFHNNTTFNEDISSWNTSNVIKMDSMFRNSSAFNQNIRGWDTLSGPVDDYSNMFMGATKMIETYDPTGQDLASFGTSPNYTPTADFFNVPLPPICFPKGTPVTTDQGEIAIEKLNPDKHSIRGHNIVAITQSQPLQKHIVCFEKDSLSKKVPSQQTLCSMEHKVFYKGEMIKARNIVDLCENVTLVDYNGETLFNVLLKKHDKMMINNLICETLHPENIAAKISQMKNKQKKNKAIQELSKIIKENNVEEYKKLYASL